MGHTTVTAVTSVEELFEQLDANREEADRNVLIWQTKAKPGMFYVRIHPEADLVIYGEFIDPVESDRQAGADEDECEYMRAKYAEPHMKNFRFTKSYSVACEEGEYGDIHVCTIWAFISKEGFEEAKKRGWPNDPQGLVELRPWLTRDPS